MASSTTADVVVIGGGITGVAAAYELARAGASVILLEKDRLAAMASGWTLGGVRQSGRDAAELPLALAAVRRWADLAEELGADTGYRRRGNLRLARDAAEVERIRRLVAEQRALGLELEFLPDLASVRAVAPAIGPAVLAASFCPTDGHADPLRAVRAYAGAARRLGADIREGVAVHAIELASGRVRGVATKAGPIAASRVVVAAGMHAPELLAPLGLGLPLVPKVVTVLQTVPLAPCFDPVFGVANADCAGRQELDGRLRVTTGIGDWPHDVGSWSEEMLMPPAGELMRLIARVSDILPVVGQARVARVWGGLIDLTPDGLPVLDAPPHVAGLVVAAGFSGHGFGIAPVSGELAADLALGRRPAHELAPFRLDRFAAGAAGTVGLTLHG
ncbi:NAD(P)/FAD-dependent oxidoreductase [Falsiroseomonas oryziterrae]|uniref:NAD(P)/FAD-dependent oxidoreductase n=1 Tax=Falsiroseomonas oryziterrae TaxID=2911368 RepID=UPI001F191C64|nr:FAD-binding oxidoreductase [Roseomonas sp. NPKOSM-4]